MMKPSFTKVLSGAMLVSALVLSQAQAQNAAPRQIADEDLPLLVWLNGLAPEADKTKADKVDVKPLDSLKPAPALAATSYKRKTNMKSFVSKPKKKLKKPHLASVAAVPAVKPPVTPVKPVARSVAAVAQLQAATAKAGKTQKTKVGKSVGAAPRVYTINDIFGIEDTNAVPKTKPTPPQSTATVVASAAPLTARPTATPAKTKKKVNMKTWKSHAKKKVVARASTPPGVDPKFARKNVSYKTSHTKGTIVVDTSSRYLYLVEGEGKAVRYGIGVGRQGFTWKGSAKINRKAKWPAWHPPAEMRKREPWLPARMEGGPENPLGARALYLYSGGKDTLYRIHGTNQPETIGQAVSSGCIRLINDDISDLYSRIGKGAKVVVL